MRIPGILEFGHLMLCHRKLVVYSFHLGQQIRPLTSEVATFSFCGRFLQTAILQLQQLCPAMRHEAAAEKFLASCKHTRVANSIS